MKVFFHSENLAMVVIMIMIMINMIICVNIGLRSKLHQLYLLPRVDDSGGSICVDIYLYLCICVMCICISFTCCREWVRGVGVFTVQLLKVSQPKKFLEYGENLLKIK